MKNIERISEKARGPVSKYVGDIISAGGDNVIAVFVYGSVTGEAYIPGRSDINIGAILKDNTLHALKPFRKIVRTGFKHRINVPLFLTLEYIQKSLDTFPIEFLGMKETAVMLLGGDIFTEMKVANHDVRRECEYQLKGKIITIKQAYLERSMGGSNLTDFTRSVARSLVPVFKEVLRLKRGADLPIGKLEVFDAISKEFGMDVSILEKALSGGKVHRREMERYMALFLEQLENVSDTVDNMAV